MTENHTDRLTRAQEDLQVLLAEILPRDGNLDLGSGLAAYRRGAASELVHGESSLAFCLIAQGAKELFLGDSIFVYDKDNYLITSFQLPTISHIVEASPEKPYLSIKLDLDPAMVSSVLLASAQLTMAAEDTAAFNVTRVDADLMETVVRLVRVSQNTAEAQFLMPMVKRELIFRLLMGSHGGRLSQIAGMGPTSQRISSALRSLREEFDQPLRIPEIAQRSGMSVSSFHDHFKRVTGLTPLQYQKHLRLREARRLLLSQDIDVANAGFQVGYNDASHFNRDYKKLFGQSPMRDIESLREAGPLALSAS